MNNQNVISVKCGKEPALEISSKRAGEVLLGDFDSSKEVELSDFTAFAKSYGKYNALHDIAPASLGTGLWANIYCSAKPDNIVDLNDFIVFAKNYGKKSPIPVIQEVFEEINRPGLEYNLTDDYFMVKPWNYEKESNASRKYPLLIYLHGSDQTKYMKNLYYMGTGYYSWSDTVNNFTAEYNKTIADNFRKTYPCFMYVPQTPTGTGSWDTKKIISQIEKFKKDYRIDTSRIYLHGFSMGGSGTYELANAYYDSEYKQLFAGIIRLTGSTGSILRDEIAAKTPTWLMIGLQDTAARVTVARDAYTFLKNHSSMTGAVETSSSYMVGTHQANTVILTKDGKERVKKTEYPNDAHFITAFPWEDPTVWAWMFGNSVQQSTVTPTPVKTLTGISVTKQPTKLS